MPYDAFIRERFFKPLGMTSSYALGEQTETDFAQGYGRAAHGWKPEPASRADAVFASGNLVSTAADMQRWNRSLLNATLLSRKTIEEMFTIPTSEGAAHTNYASGWFIEPSGVVWHGGSLAGYGTVNMLVPKTGYAIVILSNTSPSPTWRPEQAARDVYNSAKLGPALPPLLPRVRTTVPQ